MKSYTIRFSLLLAVLSLFACEKVENKISFENGTEPVLTGSATSIRLEAGEEQNIALRLNWTNPNYTFTTGLSSQDVKYTLEIDTLGGNFNSSRKYTTVFSKDLSKTYTVGELNAILGNSMQLQLDPRRNYTFEARITSSLGIGTDAVPKTSNKITFTARPFPPPPKVPVPDAGSLWITGSAVGSNWSNPFPVGSPFLTSQRFTRLNNTNYELTVTMIPGGGYKLIQAQGDWGSQYSKLSGTALNGEFEKRDATQFDAPAEAGVYKLSFNFQLGTYTVVKQ